MSTCSGCDLLRRFVSIEFYHYLYGQGVRSEVLVTRTAILQIFYAEGCLPEALRELRHFAKRAFLICDMPMRNLGFVDRVVAALAMDGVSCEVFDEVMPDPVFSVVTKGVDRMRAFKPDVCIALGGGSPMDAAKVRLARPSEV